MIGCPVAWKCLVACRLGELSQQPTRPHSTHSRSSTHVPPLARQSWQPGWLTLEIRIWSRWVHSSAMLALLRCRWWGEADRVGERDAAGLHDPAHRLLQQGEEAVAGGGAKPRPGSGREVVGAALAGVAGGPGGRGQGPVCCPPDTRR